MPHYRRNRVSGGTYFFTVVLEDRGAATLVKHVGLLRAAVRDVTVRRPFHNRAWVVLPDHLHAVWTLPDGDSDYSTRWKEIKGLFSRSLPDVEGRSAVQVRRNEKGVWQNRFWEHTIRDERDFAAHVDYVHFNPVKHGLVANAADWPYSSFHRAVALGSYPAGWGDGAVDVVEAGEP